jgi:hypothetical protein
MALLSFATAQSQINGPRVGTWPYAAVAESDRGLCRDPAWTVEKKNID